MSVTQPPPKLTSKSVEFPLSRLKLASEYLCPLLNVAIGTAQFDCEALRTRNAMSSNQLAFEPVRTYFRKRPNRRLEFDAGCTASESFGQRARRKMRDSTCCARLARSQTRARLRWSASVDVRRDRIDLAQYDGRAGRKWQKRSNQGRQLKSARRRVDKVEVRPNRTSDANSSGR